MPKFTVTPSRAEQATTNTTTLALLTAILTEMARGPDGVSPVIRVLVDAHFAVNEMVKGNDAVAAACHNQLSEIFFTVKRRLDLPDADTEINGKGHR